MKFDRVSIIIVSLLNNHSQVISNFLISFIVIKYANASLWGEQAYFMAVIQVVTVVASWGSKDYLLKEFSLYPAGIKKLWVENIFSRLLIPFIICIAIYIIFPFPVNALMIVWIFSLFISKSYDVFIFYHKSFAFSLFTELLSLTILLLLILCNRDQLDINYVLSSYMYSGLLKAFLFIIYYRKETRISSHYKINIRAIKNATPFFILAFVGILSTKVDIFCINYFMVKETLGNYQVFFSFLLLIQGLGYLLVEPFSKNLYRLDEKSLKKIRSYLLLAGLLVSSVGIVAVYFILFYFYKIDLSLYIYVYGFLFCIPVFLYSIIVYKLFKFHNERWVIYISVSSILLNVILNFFTIPIWDLTGVLFSTMIVQWGKLLSFKIIDVLLSAKLKK
jgi:O-antigen/teichoic acid export membrane protein